LLDYKTSFIETQFPISKISKESYKERKSGSSQTLTGLGKWWGRKPLVMVRAAVIGSLLPASDNPEKDKDIFLKIMTMDKDGLLSRKDKPIPIQVIFDHAEDDERLQYFGEGGKKISFTKDVSEKSKAEYQMLIFNRLSYDERLTYCLRPENMSGPSEAMWSEINEHLETEAHSIQELVEQLGLKRFGRKPIFGDCFVGGGSNAFEPARLGCDVYASDLNPIAGLLTWSGLNIIGAPKEESIALEDFQERVFDHVSKIVDELDVETNSKGDIAKYYLYCNEVVCPECGYKVPTMPSLIISKKSGVAVILEPNNHKGIDMNVVSNLSPAEMEKNEKNSTMKDNSLVCPHCKNQTSLQSLKGGDDAVNLRKWEKSDFQARPKDVFTERLYAIKFIRLNDLQRKDDLRKKEGPVTDASFGSTYYSAPSKSDLDREKKIVEIIKSNIDEWQSKGYLPSAKIESGYNTDQPIREKGWTYWHQLFNPRQLLVCGLLSKAISEMAQTTDEIAIGTLSLNNTINRYAKLAIWDKNGEKSEQVFSNQSLNTLYNYACRTTFSLHNLWKFDFINEPIDTVKEVKLKDAKDITNVCDIWITDPPYADAVNYHELTEYFLAWDKTLLKKVFPDWHTDSKRALAIKGVGQSFNESMVEVYKNLAGKMSENGMQIVMFTHQDTKVWAELAMILWTAGLRVSSAWCIATETDAVGLKKGNYVKGTVLMILRKRTSEEMAFRDEIYEEIRDGVKNQIESMRNIEDKDDPDFIDGDYLLAAYVAALKVLTSYKDIEGLDVQYELSKAREDSKESPVTQIINTAKKEAYDYLVPEGLDSFIWRGLTVEERFYIKGFEMELNGITKMSAFQEVARGFGIRDYKDMLGSTTANHIRVKTPKEYGTTQISEEKFGASILRNLLLAIHLAVKMENTFEGRNYLKSKYNEDNNYWRLKSKMITMLDFLSKAANKANMQHWVIDSEYAGMLREALRNDSV